MSDLSIQNRMIGLIGTVGAAVAIGKHQKDQKAALQHQAEREKVHDEQFATKMAAKEKDQQIKEQGLAQAADKEKTRALEAKAKAGREQQTINLKKEKQEHDLALADKQFDLRQQQEERLGREHQQSNAVRMMDALTRAGKANSEAGLKQAKTLKMLKSIGIAEDHALFQQALSQDNYINTKEGMAQLEEMIKQGGFAQ